MELSDNAAEAKNLAESYFREEKSNCAEAVMRAVLKVLDTDCPIEFLRLGSPFGRGMGEAGCACGALIGGQLVVGKFLGRDEIAGAPPARCAKAARLLHDRFKKMHGATCCRILHRREPFGSEEQINACSIRAGNGAELAVQVLREILEDSQKQSWTGFIKL